MTFSNPPAPSVITERRPDGSILLRSGLPLPEVARSLPHLFDAAADRWPDRPFVRQRTIDGEGWREIRYGAAQRVANGLAQWLIDQGVGFGDAVCYLSEPSIEHAVAAVGIQRSGAAIAPISVAYSLLSDDFSRLRYCVSIVSAKVLIVGDAELHERSLRALADLGIPIVAVTGDIDGLAIHRWSDIVDTVPTETIAERMDAIGPDSTARIMFTSGSTGSPKATPQPQANLTVTIAQNQSAGILDFGGEGPQILEAMPFSHIMAGNFNFGNIVATAGTMWIDDGKPTPQLFAKTLRNLRDLSPHYLVCVPVGYAMLCDAMEDDPDLRDSFFRNLKFLGFGGALLPDALRDRIMALSRAARGAEVPIFNFYGATEYLFGALRYWSDGPSDVIGLPLPTTTLKLIDLGDRYELRVKGPTLMPRSGYIGAEDAAAGLFDEEGFYTTGDAVHFADPQDHAKGLVFAGRLSEDFKLATGTFVNVTDFRENLLIAVGPSIQEIVLCGVNESYVGVLVWLRPGGDKVAARDALARSIDTFNLDRPSSSRRIGAALIVEEPLSFSRGEITPKGNVAARVVREVRKQTVDRLFAPIPDSDVLIFTKTAEPQIA